MREGKKMKSRYGIRSYKYNVMMEVEGNLKGKDKLIELRKNDIRFKGCHIQNYVQAMPHIMPLETLIPIYEGWPIKEATDIKEV